MRRKPTFGTWLAAWNSTTVIGGKFLHAGPGFGGSCFPKDTAALLKTAQDNGVTLRIVEAVAAVNELRKRAMARRVLTALDGSLRGQTVAVWGLTFKPNTDDTREFPALPLITALLILARQCGLTIQPAWNRLNLTCPQ